MISYSVIEFYRGDNVNKKYSVGGVAAENDNEAIEIAKQCMSRHLFINSLIPIEQEEIYNSLRFCCLKRI